MSSLLYHKSLVVKSCIASNEILDEESSSIIRRSIKNPYNRDYSDGFVNNPLCSKEDLEYLSFSEAPFSSRVAKEKLEDLLLKNK